MKMMVFIQIFIYCAVLHSVIAVDNPIENSTTSATPEYLDMLLKSKQYEEFSRVLNIDDVSRVQPSIKGQQYLGDILYQPWQIQTAQPTVNYRVYTVKKWENYEVPYSISSGYTTLQQQMISNVIGMFNRLVSPVQYRPRRKSDLDYVFFFNGNGCFSTLGRKGGPQELSLQSNGCLYQGHIFHELLHAIGISHEHERYDRDKYIRVHFNNIPKDLHDQFEKMYLKGIGAFGDYDYNSIMHYTMFLRSNGKQAFTVLNRNIDTDKIGKRQTPTFKDLWNVKKLYGVKPAAVTTTTTTTTTPRPTWRWRGWWW